MPKFWQVVSAGNAESPDQQVQDFHKNLVDNNGDLYSATGVGFKSDEAMDAAIRDAVANARAHPDAMRGMSLRLQRELPAYLREFKRAFPDFHCNFPIYLLPALGRLDGAGRVVNGSPSLLLGIDNMAAEFSVSPSLDLPIFIDHELFHRYHFQVAGFSDDKGEQEILWKTLWAEGLATYVSKALNPPASLQDALWVPKDLVARAQPQLPALIEQLEPELDRTDSKTFGTFFSYHRQETAIPSRVGYYIGALVAEDLAKHESLSALAHLQSDDVRARLPQALANIRSR